MKKEDLNVKWWIIADCRSSDLARFNRRRRFWTSQVWLQMRDSLPILYSDEIYAF
jgi:hypothetical protein